MTAILDICKVVYTDAGGSDGESGSSTTYYFQTTHGVYVPGSPISTATGIVAEGPDDDWSDNPFTSVKELLRAEIIHDLKIKVGTSNGGSSNGATQTYRKGLHYADSQTGTVEDALLNKTWPVGKGAGGTIQAAYTPRRVVSRR